MPRKCAEQTVSFFTLHASWSTNGGKYPWNHINKDWMVAAMHKLVYHVGEGRSLSDLGLENSVALGVDESIGGDAMHRSAGNRVEHAEDGRDYIQYQDEFDDNVVAFMDLHFPRPDMNNLMNDSNRQTRSRPLRSFTPESPLRRRSLRAQAKPVLALAASSSSPLSSVPSNIFSSGSGSGSGGAANASTSTDGGSSSRRQTRSVARAARAGDAPAPAAPGPASRRPDERHQHHPYGTRSQQQHRGGATKKKAYNSKMSAASGTLTTTAAPAAASTAAATSRGRGRGRTVKTDAETGETYDAWSFERILDSRRDATGADFEYRVKWTYYKPTWQPAIDLADNPEEIAAFHEKNPTKLGPPAWFMRGQGGVANE